LSSQQQIEQLFEKFKGIRAMVIGDVMVDAYLYGQVERISPEAPVPVVSLTRRVNMLGGAANVALNIKALGATPLLFSVTGNDLKGREFRELMQMKTSAPQASLKAPNASPPPSSALSAIRTRCCG
jgi:D-glycero-beta-D-manno-heptose-7-phosphate kinase